jgi:hypothetical protein
MSTELRRFATRSNETLNRQRDKQVDWLWDGILARRAISLLAAPEKTGKTTLISLLLDRLRDGGQLLGRTVRPGRTILCSEEDDILWELRQPPLEFGSQLTFCRPDGRTRRCWRDFIDTLCEFGPDPLAEDADPGFDLVVIDSIMSFLPARSSDAKSLRWALHELRDVSNMPTAILLVHQMSAARSRTHVRGPLAAFADIIIDMQIPRARTERFTRRRIFTGVGRYPGTLQYVSAELSQHGSDYLLQGDGHSHALPMLTLHTVCDILRLSAGPLTRQDLLTRWPDSTPAPRADSLWRTLTRACQEGVLFRTGIGTRLHPFRYALSSSLQN